MDNNLSKRTVLVILGTDPHEIGTWIDSVWGSEHDAVEHLNTFTEDYYLEKWRVQ